jgi:hypothetical protein
MNEQSNGRDPNRSQNEEPDTPLAPPWAVERILEWREAMVVRYETTNRFSSMRISVAVVPFGGMASRSRLANWLQMAGLNPRHWRRCSRSTTRAVPNWRQATRSLQMDPWLDLCNPGPDRSSN